jgi:MoaA/NifB/PqqE/SkfB family radical SAM enzyme
LHVAGVKRVGCSPPEAFSKGRLTWQVHLGLNPPHFSVELAKSRADADNVDVMLRLVREILPRLAQSRASRAGIARPPAPINLTYSVTNKCNSRCRSCDIWKIYPAERERLADELSLGEVERVFRTVGPVYFFNISGGEPFLRKDLVEIILLACEHLDPNVVHIPTNALMPRRVVRTTEELLRRMRDAGFGHIKVTLKPSMDGVGNDHDWVRGVKGNWEKLIETVSKLQELQQEWPVLGVGVGTVISTMNIHKLPETIRAAESLDVDTYISEVAEERLEMRNTSTGITPDHKRYRKAIAPFQRSTRKRMQGLGGLELLTQAMRHVYYDLTADWLERREQVIPCYAGITNVHINPYGEVWPCAVLADSNSMGNLKDHDYDFWSVWHSPQAKEVRASIKRGECDCPLANQAYANMLLSPEKMLQTFGLMVSAKVSALLGIGDNEAGADMERAEPAEVTRNEPHPFDRDHPDLVRMARGEVIDLFGMPLPGPAQPERPVGELRPPTGPGVGRSAGKAGARVAGSPAE